MVTPLKYGVEKLEPDIDLEAKEEAEDDAKGINYLYNI